MSDIPDKNTIASLYSGQAPWDIGRPQKAFLDVADQITGSRSLPISKISPSLRA
jgi:hypothetical protein